MKTILMVSICLASAPSFAATQKNHRVPSSAKFENDCDDMRKYIAVFSQNLQSINVTAMKLLEQAGEKPDNIDARAINGSVKGMADTIDSLAAKVDKSCK